MLLRSQTVAFQRKINMTREVMSCQIVARHNFTATSMFERFTEKHQKDILDEKTMHLEVLQFLALLTSILYILKRWIQVKFLLIWPPTSPAHCQLS